MIQKRELTAMLITVVISKMLLVYPRRIILNSGQAAWMEVLYALAAVYCISLITFKLYRHKKTVMELAEMRGGKVMRIITGTAVFLILFLNFAEVMRVFPETVKIILLRENTIEFITVIFAAAAAVGAYMGIRSAAKINCMFLSVAAVIFIGFLLLLIPYYRFSNITPIFGEGYKRIFVSGMNSLSLFSDVIVLNMFLPYCKNMDEAREIFKKGIIISGAVAFMITAAYCLATVMGIMHRLGYFSINVF